jgi:hypothetical protein
MMADIFSTHEEELTMSYTATIERKRRKEFYKDSGSFKTDNSFRGLAVSGSLSLNEYSHTDDITLDLSVHAVEEAVVVADTVKGAGRDFVTVDIAAYHDSEQTLRNSEVILFMSERQARALRDSLNALDI